MDLLDIGVIAIGWITFATLVLAFATAAGRADRRDERVLSARRAAPRRARDPQLGWLSSATDRRNGVDRRVRAGLPTIH
ncbi:hypothetical protein [Conexibacter woesei]|uniref:Uncharacterized protein n=1 Tax=Conexibacter woesei (strain DSM 14684 / CCUG 47730 / CIP 108061 / JCM 11494 / NBRC 100937 / ID131577) TaxID=469383 RepID=D3F058_CONWI|nr:hypothetical protein [Conexibacter woesei]ADB50034.1 hypothetical protein Cwoe_1606 [Conexibacter woesei DSM 14684]